MGGDNIIIPNITVIYEGDKMKVESLNIKGIGGIKELSLNFNEGVNVICGANGIGKTTILDVIADAFSIGTRNIRRNVSVPEGEYIINFDTTSLATREIVKAFSPTEYPQRLGGMREAKYLLNFSTLRDIKYRKLEGIPGDVTRASHDMANMAVSGVRADDIKGWFTNRYVFSLQSQGFSKVMRENLDIAIQVFSIMDSTINFEYVDSHSLDIMISTPKGTIYFEYLSSGYKTCIYIILGILKELEYRFYDSPITYNDFEGIILIDEIDLHLHPTWQAQLVKALKTIFIKAQIIATTHSPSILQSLNKDEIIAMGLNENGNTIVKDLELGEYGLQGWTLEEILQDVMGMPSTTSEVFQNTMAAFDKAMMEENIPEIKKNYELLDKMLHPNSTQRKLLKIQMAGLEE